MRRIKSRQEMYNALHLTQSEIGRLFGLSRTKSKKVFDMAMARDREALADRLLFEDKVRIGSVLWVLGISRKEFDTIIGNELKAATP